MKKSRFTEAQIVSILRGVDGGTPVTELARKHGVHANTIRLWRDTYTRPEIALRVKEYPCNLGLRPELCVTAIA